jgi:O-antigen/teichoic acid export membrane protein
MYNLVFGLLSQIIILALGFIIPRLFLLEYGSDVNGLFSSVNEIFGYVALLEAGIGAATVQALYSPIVANDRKGISEILSATNRYYRKVSLYYFICITAISIVYPFIVQSDIDKVSIGFVVFLQGLSGVINFYFQATIKQLIVAEGKSYVESNVHLFIYILTSAAKIVMIYFSTTIVMIQLATLFVSIVRMLIYRLYFKKNYSWVSLKEKPRFSALRQKNSFLIHQISLLVFSSTDMIILSVFCDLRIVSVYSVYMLVFTGANTLIGTIHNSFSFLLSHKYVENKKDYVPLHDAYENYYVTLVFAMISVIYTLIVPFIQLYTRNVQDTNYVIKYLPILFSCIQLLSGSRMVCNNLIRVAGHMKQTVPRSLTEMFINIIVSVVLVQFIGIHGVLIGTIVALSYRSNDIIIYANIKILNRSPFKTYKTILINSFLFGVVVYVNTLLPQSLASYTQLIYRGLVLSVIIFPAFFIISSLLNKSCFFYGRDMIRNALQSRHLSSQ